MYVMFCHCPIMFYDIFYMIMLLNVLCGANSILMLFNFKKFVCFFVLFCFMCFWYVVKYYVLFYVIVLFCFGKCFIVNININTSSMAHAIKIPSVLGRSYEF